MRKNSAWKWASAEEVKADFDAYAAEVGGVGCIAFRCGSVTHQWSRTVFATF